MKKLFTFAALGLLAAAVLSTASCKKDGGNDPQYYTYDGQKVEIAWAGYYYDDPDGYCFGISPTVPAGQLFDEPAFFEVDWPAALLGQKADLSTDYEGLGWTLYGYFENDGTQYYFHQGDDGTSYDTSGSNNWVKVTKNSANNYTLEFSMTIGGKLLTGRYSGPFIKYDNYEDVGPND